MDSELFNAGLVSNTLECEWLLNVTLVDLMLLCDCVLDQFDCNYCSNGMYSLLEKYKKKH